MFCNVIASHVHLYARGETYMWMSGVCRFQRWVPWWVPWSSRVEKVGEPPWTKYPCVTQCHISLESRTLSRRLLVYKVEFVPGQKLNFVWCAKTMLCPGEVEWNNGFPTVFLSENVSLSQYLLYSRRAYLILIDKVCCICFSSIFLWTCSHIYWV